MKFQLLPHGSSNSKRILARKGKFEIIIIIDQTIDVSDKNTARTIYKSMTNYGEKTRGKKKKMLTENWNYLLSPLVYRVEAYYFVLSIIL